MRNRFYHIAKVYWCNGSFRFLALTVLLVGAVSKVAYHNHWYVFADDFFTLLFVVTLWLAFHFGIVIKQQFARGAAQLRPRYRQAHVAVAVFLYATFIVLAMVWATGMRLNFPWMPAVSMVGVWGSALLVSLFVIALGYFSIGRFLLYGYCMLVVSSIFFVPITDLYKAHPALIYVPIGAWAAGLLVCVGRLFTVNEASFEYPYLFTLPSKQYSLEPVRRARRGNAATIVVDRAIKYPRAENIFRRIRHWDMAQGTASSFVGSLALVAVGMYVLVFCKISWAIDWLWPISNNFLLFVFTPLVMVSIRQYKHLAFWGYDILRPISRQRYFRDQIAAVVIRTFQYWALVIIVLGVIPARLFSTVPYITADMAGFFLLSGSILFLSIATLIMLTAIDDSVSIIVHGALIAGIVLVFLEPATFLTLKGYVLSSLVCLAGGLIYIHRGYHAWCRKEDL